MALLALLAPLALLALLVLGATGAAGLLCCDAAVPRGEGASAVHLAQAWGIGLNAWREAREQLCGC